MILVSWDILVCGLQLVVEGGSSKAQGVLVDGLVTLCYMVHRGLHSSLQVFLGKESFQELQEDKAGQYLSIFLLGLRIHCVVVSDHSNLVVFGAYELLDEGAQGFGFSLRITPWS